MNPLQPPTQWPPPAVQPPSDGELYWSRWPVIGVIPRWILASRRHSNHTWNVLQPIQDEIVSQFVSRTVGIDWPTELHSNVATLIARAIADEKSIQLPTLHPCDRLDLLFWGAYDDLAPLVFSVAFYDAFQINMTWEEILVFYDERRTLNEFVEYCIANIKRQTEDAA